MDGSGPVDPAERLMTAGALPGAPVPAIFLEVARSIGDGLSASAVWEQGRCAWTGDEVEHVDGGWQVIHRAIGIDLYNGGAGIARFLAHLWRVTRVERYRATARAALVRSLDLARASSPAGLWSGAAGVACAAWEVGSVCGDAAIAGAGRSLADRIASRDVPQALRGACDLDIVSGLAGTLVALVHLARHGTCHERAIRAVSERLMSAARDRAIGASWPMREGQEQGAHLCGIAHGAAGIAWALMEAHALVGDRRLADAAWKALDYESCWFDARHSNWPDLRSLPDRADSSSDPAGATPTFSWVWCHGAAGIGMARLRLYELTGDPRPLADASAALHAVSRAMRPLLAAGDLTSLPHTAWNFSVCHGLGSAIELALHAHRVLGRPEYLWDARALGAAGVRAAAREGAWRCGVPDGGDHPGLMLGRAGIGLVCLALSDPGVGPVTIWV